MTGIGTFAPSLTAALHLIALALTVPRNVSNSSQRRPAIYSHRGRSMFRIIHILTCSIAVSKTRARPVNSESPRDTKDTSLPGQVQLHQISKQQCSSSGMSQHSFFASLLCHHSTGLNGLLYTS